jgi:hypothetical protein
MNKTSHIITDKLIYACTTIAAVVASCMPAPATAQIFETGPDYQPYIAVMAHGASKHGATHNNYQFNEVNPGAALRLGYNRELSLQVGAYKNSFYKQTVYGALQYTPVGNDLVRVGGFAGLASGYQRNVVGGMMLDAQYGAAITTVRYAPKISKDTTCVVTFEVGFKF